MLNKKHINLFKDPKVWFFIVMCLFGVLYYTMAIANHYYFRTPALDYGLYNFYFWDCAHFHTHDAPIYSAYVNVWNDHYHSGSPAIYGYLDEHFSFTMFYFIPLYWLLNWLTGTYTLTLLQVSFILIGAWSVYKIVELKTTAKWLPLLSIAYYFLLQGHFSVFASDFNIGVVGACLVPVFIYLFEIKRFIPATIVFLLALFSKEIIALWFIFIMIVLLLQHRKEKEVVKISLWYMLGSLVFFISIFKIFIPLIHADGKPYFLFEYDTLGADPLHALLYIIEHPINTCKLMFSNFTGMAQYNGLKNEFFLVYLISGGFVLALRPQYIIWFIPIIFEKMFNNHPIRWSIEGHYAIETVTLLPLAVFCVIDTIKNTKIKYYLSGAVCLLALSVTIYKADARHRNLPWANTQVENICDKNFFDPGFDAKQIHKELKRIPDDAKVSASEKIAPHLAQRRNIYVFPYVQDADYIAAFTFHDFYMISDSDYAVALNKYILSPNWNIIANSYKFVLLKREPNAHNPASIFMCDASKVTVDSLMVNLTDPRMNLILDSYPKMYFSKELNKNNITQFACDEEKLSAGGDSLMCSGSQKLEVGGTYSTDRAHSGTHSVKLSFAHPFGVTYHFKEAKAGDMIRISVWRFTNKGDGMIGLTFNNGTIAYSGKPIAKDEAGWELITLSVIVPKDFSDINFYLWDNGAKPVYFDDLQVSKFNR